MKKILPIVIAVVLLLAAAFAVYAILVGPSKQPYRDALTQYKNVYNANVAFTNSGAAINASNASDEQFAKNIETVNASLKSLKFENDALAKEQVLTEGEGKELYDTFNEKLQAYTAYNEEVISSIEMLRPVLYTCINKMSNVTEDQASADEIRDCAKRMGAMTDIPDDDYEAFIEASEVVFYEVAKNIEKAAALKAPSGKDKPQYDVYLEQREEFMQTLGDASTTLSKDLQVHRAEVDITEAAMALDAYLSKKSSLF